MKFQQNGSGPIINIIIPEIKYSMNGRKNVIGHLNINNGEVIYDESPSGDIFVKIPKYGNQYEDMVKFVNMLPDGKDKNALNAVIYGPGAFRNFRELTRDSSTWNHHKRDTQFQRALEFLKEIGMERVE